MFPHVLKFVVYTLKVLVVVLLVYCKKVHFEDTFAVVTYTQSKRDESYTSRVYSKVQPVVAPVTVLIALLIAAVVPLNAIT